MSLLNDFASKCVIMEKRRIPDGAGGWLPTEWTEGAEFVNYMSLDTSMEARIAEKQGVSSLYSVLVDKNLPIDYNDYFKDVESGNTYRVTSNPEDKVAPKRSTLELKMLTAERVSLPE